MVLFDRCADRDSSVREIVLTVVLRAVDDQQNACVPRQFESEQ